jgi:hypothetical protein
LAGDSIWIAESIYYPDTSGNRSASFEFKSGVKIFGDFYGNEADLAQRNWINHPAILSGDIGIHGDSTDNSYNVVYLFEPDSNTVLDGLIFRDGMANNAGNAGTVHSRLICGGGLYIMADAAAAYPEIRNCKFIHNTALYYGGGAMVNGRNGGSVGPRWINCSFESNHARNSGGGLAKFGASNNIRNDGFNSCIFSRNYANTRGGGVLYFDADGQCR